MTIFIVTSAAIAIVALILGVLVLSRDPRNAAYQSFFLFAVGVALSSAAKPFFREGDDFLAVLFVWWGSEATVLGSFFLVHVLPDGQMNRRFIWFLAPWFLLFVSTPALLIMAASRPDPAVFFWHAYHVTLPFFAMVMGGYLVVSFFFCLRQYANKLGLPPLLARGLMFVVTVSASTICAADLILPAFGICLFSSASNFFALAILVIGGYFMLRYGAGNSSTILGKGISYVLSLISVAVLFFGIEFAVEKFLYKNDEVVDVATAVLGAFAFCPLRDFFDKVTDQIFSMNSCHILTAMKDLGERLSTPLDRAVLFATITEFLRLTIRPTETVFFTVDERGAEPRFVSVGATPREAAADYTSLAALFLKHVHEGIIIADTMRLFRGDGESEKDAARALIKERAARLGVAAIVSIATQGKARMIMMVGYKCSGALFSREDSELLDFVARRAAISLENFELREFVEQQAERFEERVTARARRLKSMYESQARFLTDVSHEFKTPLAILKMHASVFAGSKDAEQKKAWYVMDTTLDRLSRMVGNLLDAARQNSLREASCKQHIVLEDMLREARDDCVMLAEDKGVNIGMVSEKISILGDWDKLKEVMLNLLSNALRHTPAGGHISMAARVIDGEAEITVRDTGSGISQENLEHIFERFYRIGESSFTGTGIGLYLCRQIIEGYGGTITAESKAGQGSCFIIRLPLSMGAP